MLFTRFTQVDSSHTREYGGTGLGLSISKGIVELMEGEVWVESIENESSHFFFTCLFERCDPFSAELSVPLETTILAQEPSNLQILLVEDDQASQMVIRALIAKKGWALTVAENGKEALALMMQHEFDVVLMDCQMPIMDGYEATKFIRKQEASQRHTYIIAMTAHALPGDIEKCIDVGMDDYISKPIDFKKLLERITVVTNGENASTR